MSIEEQEAESHLMHAKDEVKLALLIVDPNAAEPFAQAMLRALDSIASANQMLVDRFPL
jgi:hypothetical protein